MEPYVPINCSFYDELESLATLKREATIVYRPDGQAAEVTIQDTPVTFYIEEKAEYMKLASGMAIRLDWLVSVDGKPLPKAC